MNQTPALAHSERKHSKFSASGAERWFNCSASVEAQEPYPSKENEWSRAGTIAHEVLEQLFKFALQFGSFSIRSWSNPEVTNEMVTLGANAARFILDYQRSIHGSELLIETRVYLDFIHPEAFGTFDSAIIDHFGTLHVFDYKFGLSHVSAEKNLQMIFYALALAKLYHWNFKRVRMWIIQPRLRGYDGPTFWEISMEELLKYVGMFEAAVERVENAPTYKEGKWCHWCTAQHVCPLKKTAKNDKLRSLFMSHE